MQGSRQGVRHQVCKSVLGVSNCLDNGTARSFSRVSRKPEGACPKRVRTGPLRYLRLLEVCARRHGFVRRSPEQEVAEDAVVQQANRMMFKASSLATSEGAGRTASLPVAA
jgi:hypothetical protein